MGIEILAFGHGLSVGTQTLQRLEKNRRKFDTDVAKTKTTTNLMMK